MIVVATRGREEDIKRKMTKYCLQPPPQPHPPAVSCLLSKFQLLRSSKHNWQNSDSMIFLKYFLKLFPQPNWRHITLHYIISSPPPRVFTFVIFLFHFNQTLCHNANVFYFTFDFRCEMISVSFITSHTHAVPSTIEMKDP